MEDEWKAEIKKVDNGYIVKYCEMSEDEKPRITFRERLYEEKDESNELDKNHVVELLYDLIEYFGEDGDKYDAKRICIGYIRGHKYDGEISKDTCEEKAFGED